MRKTLALVILVALPAATWAQAPPPVATTEAAPPQPKAWTQEPTAYRGLEWGTPVSQAGKILGRYDECSCRDAEGHSFVCPLETFVTNRRGPADIPEQRSCQTSLSVGDVAVQDRLEFENDRLVGASMEFAADDFGTMRDIFLEKYGPPLMDTEEDVQNRMGAHFKNETLTWRGGRVMVILSRFTSDLTKSRAIIALNAWAERRLEDAKRKKREGVDAF